MIGMTQGERKSADRRTAGDISELSPSAATQLASVAARDAAVLDCAAFVALADVLRRYRLFPELQSLAASSVWAAHESGSPRLMCLRAQALIEQEHYQQAAGLLNSLISGVPGASGQMEAQGLLGRLEKQRYVNAVFASGHGEPAQLRASIDAYLGAYESHRERPLWHGINAVAMLARARRDRVRHAAIEQFPEIARSITQRIHDLYEIEGADAWHLATAAEAHLALGDHELAELWVRRYCSDPAVEPFALASTLRQFKEVWQLASTEGPARRALRVLEQAYANVGRAAILTPQFVQQAEAAMLEKVFGTAAFMSLEKLKLGLERCKAVARVETTIGEGFGTGFVLPGNALREAWGKTLVFLTNAHVLSLDEPEALAPESARVAFHGMRDAKDKPFTTSCGELLFHSPAKLLDCTVLRLKKAPPRLQPYTIAAKLPATGSSKVYAIGHPRGGGMMFSLQDNELLGYGKPPDARVHYRAPTEPGSSGSPVFNVDWELIALHHSGSSAMTRLDGTGTYEANEGISLHAIRAAVNA